ncbi:MAG: FAD-binding oxidoreductase [Rhizobiaceae bacterium]
MIEQKTAPNWGRLIGGLRPIVPFRRAHLNGPNNSRLPYGNGRSYGDSCHNDGGVLLDSRSQNAIIKIDRANGILRAQTGILLSEILTALKDTNWFLPVVPGTKFITLGGAIANDIHGKNHGHRGTFGCFVKNFVVATSDGQTRTCSPTQNTKLFGATIGGMGLTGFILEAEIELIRTPSHFIKEQKTPFNSLKDFIELSETAESEHEYSVAWIDSLATGKKLGRGIFIAGDHVKCASSVHYGKPKFTVPFTPPIPLVSGLPLRVFNALYNFQSTRQKETRITHPNSFFFPLDAIGGWNKLYGPKGLFQHQCALPLDTGPDALHALIRASQLAKHGSFLTVLKRFGDHTSPGLLSFPKLGFTLTLDFPNKGEKTRALLNELDSITLEAGGRVNPYKDARMSAETFQQGFSNWEKLEAMRDPMMMSDFWHRVTAKTVSRTSLTPPSLETSNINQALQPPLQEHPVEPKDSASLPQIVRKS